MYNQDDYQKDLYSGMVFSNYPLTSGDISDNHRLLEDALEIEGVNVFSENRDQVQLLATETYGDFHAHEAALFNYFQLRYSAPAARYDARQDIVTLQFPLPTNQNVFVAFHLSGQEFYQHLNYAVQQSAKWMDERSKVPRQTDYVQNMPVSMIDEMHHTNLKNCERFARLVGMSFDAYGAKGQQGELMKAAFGTQFDPAVATLYDVQCVDMLGNAEDFDNTHAVSEISRQLNVELKQNAPRLCN